MMILFDEIELETIFVREVFELFLGGDVWKQVGLFIILPTQPFPAS